MKPMANRGKDPPRQAMWLVHGAWIAGLVMIASMGVFAKVYLDSQGIPTVSWSRGVALMIPIGLFLEIPFVLLALLLRQRLRRVTAHNPQRLPIWTWAGAGAVPGMVVCVGRMAFEPLTYHGPGGLAEVVGMMLALWMMSLPGLLLIAAIGAAVGGGLGAALYLLVHAGGQPHDGPV